MLITLQKQVLEVGHVCDVAFNRDRLTAGCFAIADDVSGAFAIRHVNYTDVRPAAAASRAVSAPIRGRRLL